MHVTSRGCLSKLEVVREGDLDDRLQPSAGFAPSTEGDSCSVLPPRAGKKPTLSSTYVRSVIPSISPDPP
jgi:hypothetical protein